MSTVLLFCVIMALGICFAFMFSGFRSFRTGSVLIPIAIIAYLGAAAGKSLGVHSHYDLWVMYCCWALGALGFLIGCTIKQDWDKQFQHT